jgi:tRNA dimethylallyltransferase
MTSENNTFEEHFWRRAKNGATEPHNDHPLGRGRPPVDGSEGAFRKSVISDAPTIIILGPTGSGKTGISIKLAKALNGEIISADSRAIYKGMDIGTAKPTKEEMQGITHYGIDLVEPGERFTVSDWKTYAESKIADIKARNKVPIIAGGTGLYIDALIYDYHFKGPTGMKIGDIEQKSCSDRKEIKGNYLIIGIDWPTEKLRTRLKQRIDQMFCQELYDETTALVQKYGWGSGAMKSDIYEYAWKYLQGELTLEEAKEKCFYEDYHLAKRQLTWFKRNDKIIWLPLDDIYSFVIDKFHKSC